MLWKKHKRLNAYLVEFELTHQEVAEAVGKSRTTVTNLLRLNNLQRRRQNIAGMR